jgi:hypothetical protein
MQLILVLCAMQDEGGRHTKIIILRIEWSLITSYCSVGHHLGSIFNKLNADKEI